MPIDLSGAVSTERGANQRHELAAPIVRLDHISKVFAASDVDTYALRDVSLEIRAGEFVAISGPSGCGKSTLLSIIGLLDTPSDGRYELDGVPITQLDAAARAEVRNQHLGFVFQSFNLIGDLTVRENVELPLTYRRMNARERAERSQEVLERVGLGHRANHYPNQLSGGQQQRTAVARAIIGAPQLLLADEPTGNLDSSSGDAVMALLHELHEGGTTMCLVTHDPRYADGATRVFKLLDGQLTG